MNKEQALLLLAALLGGALALGGVGLGKLLNTNYTPGSMSVDRDGKPVPPPETDVPGGYIQRSGDSSKGGNKTK